MKKIVLLLAVFVVLGAASVTTFAQHNYRHQHNNINKRQRHQQRRIAHGIRSGRLNGREAIRLERREVRTNRMERRMRHSGGGLSHRERNRLNRRLNRNSHAIYHQKHDRQHRH